MVKINLKTQPSNIIINCAAAVNEYFSTRFSSAYLAQNLSTTFNEGKPQSDELQQCFSSGLLSSLSCRGSQLIER